MNYARISDCKRYRYELGRDLTMLADSYPRKTCMWVMLNPSTADATTDDRTISRCMEFSKAWGFDRMVVGNLYAYRATNPQDMWAASRAGVDIVGSENLERLRIMASYSNRIVCGWGSKADHNQAADVLQILLDQSWKYVCFLDRNKDGQPKHPLYIHGDRMPSFYCDIAPLHPAHGA